MIDRLLQNPYLAAGGQLAQEHSAKTEPISLTAGIVIVGVGVLLLLVFAGATGFIGRGLTEPPPEGDDLEPEPETGRAGPPKWLYLAYVIIPLWAAAYVVTNARLPKPAAKPAETHAAETAEPRATAEPSDGEDGGGDLAAGKTVYDANCLSCHGAEGAGGIGPAFKDGRSEETFATMDDHIEFVKRGTVASCTNPFRSTYGTGTRRTVQTSAMPCWEGKLSEDEIRNVVAYERSL